MATYRAVLTMTDAAGAQAASSSFEIANADATDAQARMAETRNDITKPHKGGSYALSLTQSVDGADVDSVDGTDYDNDYDNSDCREAFADFCDAARAISRRTIT